MLFLSGGILSRISQGASLLIVAENHPGSDLLTWTEATWASTGIECIGISDFSSRLSETKKQINMSEIKPNCL